MLAGMVTAATETVGMVGQVDADSSPGEVVSRLTPVAERIGSTAAGIAGVVREVDGVKSQVAAVLKGGQPGPLVAMVDQVKQALVPLVAVVGGAKRVTEETISEARQTGNF